MVRLIWQLRGIYQPGYDFDVLFDREFVGLALEKQIGKKTQDRFNELGFETLGLYGIRNRFPYTFDRDTAFIRQLSLGHDGKFLVLDGCHGKSPLAVYNEPKPIPFGSHNIDHPSETFGLLALVDLWVTHVVALQNS